MINNILKYIKYKLEKIKNYIYLDFDKYFGNNQMSG
jgi:hypothetical protein